MSFYCEHCHFKNTEIQSAGEIQERGGKYVLKIDRPEDMERQIVKSDTAVFRIEDLDIEIPPGRGKLTNVEGVLAEVLADLQKDQRRRKLEAPEVYKKIDAIVQSLIEISIRANFTISLDDPAGNSWIEPSPLDEASKYTRTDYPRTPEQNAALGLGGGDVEDSSLQDPTLQEPSGPEEDSLLTGPVVSTEVEGGLMEGVDILNGQLYSLPCHCPGCGKSAMMNLQMVNVPYFKQVIISAVVCTHCGYRTNDVKSGGEMPEKGQRIWLNVENSMDLRRDILKSETCMLKIPACKVEVVPGTMGGRFTTVEGLLTQIRDDLRGSIFDADDVEGSGGDSMPDERKKGWNEFFDGLDKAICGEMKYTILMEDPLSNSYVQSFTAPDPDPQIKIEDYERTAEEEEELGLADMRTERAADGEYVKELVEKGVDKFKPEEEEKVQAPPAAGGSPVEDKAVDKSTKPEVVSNDLPVDA